MIGRLVLNNKNRLMQRLEWDEGMSVGVEAIDNDHKQLLALINEISDAIDRNKAPAVIEDVFASSKRMLSSIFPAKRR